MEIAFFELWFKFLPVSLIMWSIFVFAILYTILDFRQSCYFSKFKCLFVGYMYGIMLVYPSFQSFMVVMS